MEAGLAEVVSGVGEYILSTVVFVRNMKNIACWSREFYFLLATSLKRCAQILMKLDTQSIWETKF